MFAHVALDIPTRGLSGTFDYRVPDELAETCVVGATVLVTFSRRRAVGYVMGLSPAPTEGLDPARILPIGQVLAPGAFDGAAARVAAWMAREYACPLCEAIHPFLPPGQTGRITRSATGEGFELVREGGGPVDERWVSLLPAARDFEPRKNASRQRAVLAALGAGAQRMAELSATIPGAPSAVASLEKRGLVLVETRRRMRELAATTLSSAAAPRPKSLTHGQVRALEAIGRATRAAQGDVVLIDGVTGSGKTEVYLEAIAACLDGGRGAIVIVPEISLTAQTVGRFRARFGDEVAILHSRLGAGERRDQWDLVRSGRARVVVGARSALFAPLSNVGLIVIDEEHEWTYKQESSPRYHAREVAARLAAERGCALVLGSATPSLESLERCREGTWGGVGWTRVHMPERPGAALMPEVRIVDMTSQFAAGNRSIISSDLRQALEGVAARREKAVLLLNRRGFATFLMCRECGAVPECPHCSTALTYHERTHCLMCHSCGRSWPVRAWPDPSTRCPACGSRYLAAFGAGTQRVEDELALILPEDVDIIRMDADTTRGKDGHQRLLERFDSAECAVLVGTQMIAKGLDFPEVTLVGVINADTTLKMADFRAAERTYDLLEQVAGRAGRGSRPGEVIIQSYWATHPAIRAAAAHNRRLFSDAELEARKEGGYPPFGRLSNVVCWGRNEQDVRRATEAIAAGLAERVGGLEGWEVLGPSECLKSKVKDRYRRHVLVKSPAAGDGEAPAPGPVLDGCVRAASVARGVNVAIDVDAYDLF